MIPFSACHLKKTFGESIFQSKTTQTKIFSYTIYSKTTLNKFQQSILDMEQRNPVGTKEGRVLKDKEEVANKDDEFHNKYLKTLTSRAVLVDFNFSSVDDLTYIERTYGVKFNLDHRMCSSSNISKRGSTGILLLTREARHVQKFKYSLMKDFDQNIMTMEEGINITDTKGKTKSKKKKRKVVKEGKNSGQ